jgi:UPF0755 protein
MKAFLKMFPIVVLLLAILAAFSLLSVFFQTGTNDRTVTLEIPKGSSADQVASQLTAAGVVRRKMDFKIVARLLGVADKLEAGRYRFAPHPVLTGVVNKLAHGEIAAEDPLKVSFPEGTSIYKMGTILEKEGAPCFKKFRKLSQSREGYLFPDTYIFDKNISAEALAGLMEKRFREIVLPYWEANRKATKYNLREIITLASIIEKEAARTEERPVISSVFHNRLKIKMALGADPTIKYILERPSKIVYYDQLKIKSPYNTYLNRGLPPGPICNPGLSSIQAAIYPAKTDYLYFVARKDGTHIFSANYREHLKAIDSLKQKKRG